MNKQQKTALLKQMAIRRHNIKKGSELLRTRLTFNAPIATKVICFSRLLKCLRSLYGKQCGPRSDCKQSDLGSRYLQGVKCPIYSIICKTVLYIPIYSYIWKTVLYIPIFQHKQGMLNSYYPPTKSEGYSFGASVHPSVHPFRPSFRPSVCPSTLFVCPEPYLSTYWSDLIHSWYK